MPINPGHVPPEEPKFPTLPPDMYAVEIEDIELDIKPNSFKKSADDGQPEERQQYKVSFKVTDPADFKDRKLMAWINTSLRISTKAKRPGLAQFLKAVTNKDFTVDDREKLTGDFMNTLIGSKLRVSIQTEKNKAGKEFPAVVGYFAPRA